MGWWSDFRDGVYSVGAAVLAPVAAPITTAVSVLQGNNLVKSGGKYLASITDVKKISLANQLSNYNLQKLPIVGDTARYATEYDQTGKGLSNYLKNYGVLAASTVAGAQHGLVGAGTAYGVGSSVKAGDLKSAFNQVAGGYISDFKNEYGLSDLSIPSFGGSGGSTSVGGVTPATFPAAQASIDKKNLNMALIIGAVVIGSVFLLKGKK